MVKMGKIVSFLYLGGSWQMSRRRWPGGRAGNFATREWTNWPLAFRGASGQPGMSENANEPARANWWEGEEEEEEEAVKSNGNGKEGGALPPSLPPHLAALLGGAGIGHLAGQFPRFFPPASSLAFIAMLWAIPSSQCPPLLNSQSVMGYGHRSKFGQHRLIFDDERGQMQFVDLCFHTKIDILAVEFFSSSQISFEILFDAAKF
jgi:hypothetical protein